jgi:hypothetical protein
LQADRESLAELHNYLHNGDSLTTPTLQEFSRVAPLPASIKSERRRSLPAWTPSLLSLSSIHTIASITPHEATDFELRRRRAAKLTQFFGVDYRTMIKDVLESIEKGVEEEQKGGALNIVEAEVGGYRKSLLHYILICIPGFTPKIAQTPYETQQVLKQQSHPRLPFPSKFRYHSCVHAFIVLPHLCIGIHIQSP